MVTKPLAEDMACGIILHASYEACDSERNLLKTESLISQEAYRLISRNEVCQIREKLYCIFGAQKRISVSAKEEELMCQE